MVAANALLAMGKARRAWVACIRGIEEAVRGDGPDPILFSMLVNVANSLAGDSSKAPGDTVSMRLSCTGAEGRCNGSSFALGPLHAAVRAELALPATSGTSASDKRDTAGGGERRGAVSAPLRKRRLPNARVTPVPAPPQPQPQPLQQSKTQPQTGAGSSATGSRGDGGARLPPPEVDWRTRARISEASAASLARATRSRKEQEADSAYNRHIRIAVGLVNASRLDTAIPLLDRLTREQPAFVDAWIVRGSVHALKGSVEAARGDFDQALDINPVSVEALRRRAEVRASLDDYHGSAADLTAALRLCGGDDGGEETALVRKRATLHTRFGNHPAASSDLIWLLDARGGGQGASADLHRQLASSLQRLGSNVDAVAALTRAAALKPGDASVLASAASVLQQWGDTPSAVAAVSRALCNAPREPGVHGTAAGLWYALGWPSLALRCLPHDATAWAGAASTRVAALASLGRYPEALRAATGGGTGPGPGATLTYKREAIAAVATVLQQPWSSLCMDAVVDAAVREAWARGSPPPAAAERSWTPLPVPQSCPSAVHPVDTSSPPWRELVPAADAIGALLQTRAQGFVANRRQHRMFGLAVLEMREALTRDGIAPCLEAAAHTGRLEPRPDRGHSRPLADRAHAAVLDTHRRRSVSTTVAALLDAAQPAGTLSAQPNSDQSAGEGEGAAEAAATGEGSWRDDGSQPSASRLRARRCPPPLPAGTHPPGWRDVVDVAVRWRQVSEPGDAVWWLDLLPTQAFVRGFGLQTPMLHGHHRVPRYHPYCAWALRVLRGLVADRYPLTDQQRASVLAATTPRALLDAVGRDVWANTPCRSRAVSGRVLEGTRLTLRHHGPTGAEFTIRTPGLPDRCLKMDYELECLWDRLRFLAAQPVSARVLEAAVDEALASLFFFVHYAPLTRGSSAIAQALCVSILLAWRVVPTRLAPEGRQMDWEAILRPSAEAYAEAVKPWIIPSLVPADGASDALCASLRQLQALHAAQEAPPLPPTEASTAASDGETDGPVMTAQPSAQFAATGAAPQRAVLPTHSVALLANPLPVDVAAELARVAEQGAEEAAAVAWVQRQPAPTEAAVRGVPWSTLPALGPELRTVGTAVAALLA